MQKAFFEESVVVNNIPCDNSIEKLQCKSWIIRSALVRRKAHWVGQTCGGRVARGGEITTTWLKETFRP